MPVSRPLAWSAVLALCGVAGCSTAMFEGMSPITDDTAFLPLVPVEQILGSNTVDPEADAEQAARLEARAAALEARANRLKAQSGIDPAARARLNAGIAAQ